jgi:hypothetical protein
MLVLEAGEICPYSSRCPYNNTSQFGPCHGTLSTRSNTFTCSYVKDGKISEGQSPRLPGDKTGRMNIIME